MPLAPTCRLYLITPPAIADLGAFGEALRAALGAGDVAALQVRIKPASEDEVARAVEALLPIAQGAGTAVILNDRPDLAKRLGCDGVHVGQTDASVAEARRILGKEGMVGATCHDSRHLAMEAAEAGADYVAFGPTDSEGEDSQAALVGWWSELFVVPVVAVGIETAEDAADMAAEAPDFIAIRLPHPGDAKPVSEWAAEILSAISSAPVSAAGAPA